MAVVWATKSGNWSDTTVWSTGSVPTSADDVYSNSFTVNMDSNATVISLNNSTTPLIVPNNQIPIMTSNTTPSGIATGSTNSSQAYLAFDQNTSTSWSSSGVATGQLGYQFASAIVAKRYSVRSIGATTNAPRDWTFQGSNDGIIWVTLETVTGQNYGTTGNYTSPILANILSYTRYRLNITANNGAGTTLISDFEITDSTGTGVGGASGGSFNFNTAGVSVSCTSTSQGASNLFTITNATGSVSLNVGSNINVALSQTMITYSGAGNFNITFPNASGGGNAAVNTIFINKTSSGLITINGNLLQPTIGNTTAAQQLFLSSNGDTIINGNVFGNPSPGVSGGNTQTVRQTAGNLTINGNIVPTGIPAASITTSATSVFFSGTTLTLNGNTLGGDGLAIVSSGTVNVNGTLNGGNSVYANSAITINMNGDVYAGNFAPAINCSAFRTSVVNLTGNMYNTNGRMAILCDNVFISNTATTLWRMDTGGGDYKFLYSADTTPNLPATTNVRNGVTYGPALSLTGTMVVPAASDVRENVPVDNTVGTGELTSADIISGINASSDSLAVRLKNILTDRAAGNIISQYKDA